MSTSTHQQTVASTTEHKVDGPCSSSSSSSSKVIGTHSGTFHCDEAFASYLLLQTKEFAGAKIVRSRDPKVLDACDILIDVGAVFDVAKKRFDHHQRGFDEKFSPAHSIKLSSAGLVYKYFGEEVISAILRKSGKGTFSAADIKLLYTKVYDAFVEALDGIDNGVEQYPAHIKPAYRSSTNLGSRIARLNPTWTENFSDLELDQRFQKAVAMTGAEFEDCLNGFAYSWLPARSIVERAVANRFEVDKSGEILMLDTFTVWKDHLFTIEEEQKLTGTIKYVLFEDSNHSWRVAAVPDSPTSFKSRLALPEPWRGVRDDQLSAQLGLPGCVFVHASGFIGGHASKDGALAMARMALAYYAAEAAAAATKGKEETKGDSNSNEDMASCASNEFCSKKCVPCRGGVPALQGQAVQDFLQKLNAGKSETVRPGVWKVGASGTNSDHHLEKSMGFQDFATPLALVSVVGAVAEAEGHHPNLSFTWGRLDLSIFTHKIDGLTESDFVLAAKIDAAVTEYLAANGAAVKKARTNGSS